MVGGGRRLRVVSGFSCLVEGRTVKDIARSCGTTSATGSGGNEKTREIIRTESSPVCGDGALVEQVGKVCVKASSWCSLFLFTLIECCRLKSVWVNHGVRRL